MRKIPRATIERYPLYYYVVRLLHESGVEWATSSELGLGDGIKPMQIRRDLSYLDIVGKRGRGYEIRGLRDCLAITLGLNKRRNLCIVGATEIGRAWATHTWIHDQGYPVRAVFDSDPAKSGQDLAGHTVLPLSELEHQAHDRNLEIAVLTGSSMEGQDMADAVVASGIKAMICFNEASVEVPDDVHLSTRSMFMDLADMSSFVSSEPGLRIPEISVERLARYYACLTHLESLGVERITSDRLGMGRGINSDQIRKDLSYCGASGRPGYGYDVKMLRRKLGRILALDAERTIAVIGIGTFGSRLLRRKKWYEVVASALCAAFDCDESKIGKEVEGFSIHPMSEFKNRCQHDRIKIAYLTTDPENAQDACDRVVEAGIRGIVNFTEATLRVPETVLVKNVNFYVQLAVASFHLRALAKGHRF